jgi:thioredoxin reductase (NADPH)
VLVATGVSYRLLDAPGLRELAGRGVYYGANAGDAQACDGQDVFVVGAANSAGQAVLNFARQARRVVLLVRGDALEATMSQYLVERIRAADNVEVRLRTEVVAARGDEHLEEITLADRDGTKEDAPANWLFVFIGASPRTDWLGQDVARDERGFVVTGPELARPELTQREGAARWPLTRPPFALETSMPGVFAAGDVRLDSMKRVASAVGEGAMAVYLVHRYLATI